MGSKISRPLVLVEQFDATVHGIDRIGEAIGLVALLAERVGRRSAVEGPDPAQVGDQKCRATPNAVERAAARA